MKVIEYLRLRSKSLHIEKLYDDFRKLDIAVDRLIRKGICLEDARAIEVIHCINKVISSRDEEMSILNEGIPYYKVENLSQCSEVIMHWQRKALNMRKGQPFYIKGLCPYVTYSEFLAILVIAGVAVLIRYILG